MNKFLCGRLSKKGNLVKNSGCGELEFVQFDGYRFNEQELTGYKFMLDKHGNVTGEELEQSEVSDEDYRSFMIDANDYAWVALTMNSDFECPLCGKEVYVEHEQEPTECNSSI